jgi:hypothetical protein
LVSQGVRNCVAQHFENAGQRNAKLFGRPILRPVRGQCIFQQRLLFTSPIPTSPIDEPYIIPNPPLHLSPTPNGGSTAAQCNLAEHPLTTCNVPTYSYLPRRSPKQKWQHPTPAPRAMFLPTPDPTSPENKWQHPTPLPLTRFLPTLTYPAVARKKWQHPTSLPIAIFLPTPT